jgi:hypothetical protein
MSFGFKSVPPDEIDLQQAYSKIRREIKTASKTVFFAAAANHGSHAPVAFPALD